MLQLRFAKMSGAGNDFIVIDNRKAEAANLDVKFIQRVCARGLSVGADGLLLLSPADQADFEMTYYNADGSEASMCGNGARCIARFAVLIGACKAEEMIAFKTQAGLYQAQVEGTEVKLKMIPPLNFEQDIKLQLSSGERQCDFTDTGVPHVVFFTDTLNEEKVDKLGREVRYHARFSPTGTNVNFCQVLDEHNIAFRVYERGVEAETLASGTGAAASVLTAARRGWVKSPVMVKTQGNISLEMCFVLSEQGFSEVLQRGEARLIYWGSISDEATAFQISAK